MNNYYDELQACDEPARIDGWRHRLEQWLRFEVACRGLQISDSTSVIDIGCGTGRLIQYLSTDRSGGYLGVDRRQSAIERGRQDAPNAAFYCADWSDDDIDEEGPFEVGVAIGTLVDGSAPSGVERRQKLIELATRLDELTTRGFAIVVLNQRRLHDDPIRQLDPSLHGASRRELQSTVEKLDLSACITAEPLPSDFFLFAGLDEYPDSIHERIAGIEPHQEVLRRADASAADAAWLWIISEQPERARSSLAEVPKQDRRRTLLESRLQLLCR